VSPDNVEDGSRSFNGLNKVFRFCSCQKYYLRGGGEGGFVIRNISPYVDISVGI
jgi:hypothetical protein